MLNCIDVMPQLWAYIDDELTAERKDQIRAHLEKCEQYFPQYKFHRAFITLIGAIADKRLPRRARRRVFQRLLEEEAKHPTA